MPQIENELFYNKFITAINDTGRQGVVGTLSHALDELSKPELKQTKSMLQGNVLRVRPTPSPTPSIKL